MSYYSMLYCQAPQARPAALSCTETRAAAGVRIVAARWPWSANMHRCRHTVTGRFVCKHNNSISLALKRTAKGDPTMKSF